MLKAYRYRLYPTKSQALLLEQTLEMCRWVYNDTLALRKKALEQEQHSISLYETNKILTQWKKERPDLNQVHSQVLQNVQMRVDLAFKAYFRRVKAGENPGYPRFKGKGRYDSITYPQYGFKLDGDRLHLSKIGDVRIVLHRPVEGTIKTLTIRRSSTGKWYACFSVEYDPTPAPQKETTVGIDVGLESFATLSSGEKIENPRFFRTDEKALAKAQRKLSKAEKGTLERKKARKIVAHVHERIANRRLNFAHQISRQLVDRFGTIVFEDLNVKNMQKNHYLAKSIADVAWNMFITITESKAEDAGSRVILVNPRNTSQMCSRCGMIVAKTLSDRVHSCPHCGLVMDRDQNAAINIMRLGLQSQG
ncbi:RNA-guided endonuclease InsQ/TnpB family protein [Methanofollis tationis]|uniref:IS200/IS605 family element transposase accessory protein TnpB n=1 Tax=Methanofollis tationis TaxID=81417 RepID=A0A7K4HPH9_9EURY|nr:RNA-guided endonuclease TnpB family protein [Methanofollis tationis]NVO67185.1 IS200/IS605 family element transposase accessory protein TnpB [Methanofollis tationis]